MYSRPFAWPPAPNPGERQAQHYTLQGCEPRTSLFISSERSIGYQSHCHNTGVSGLQCQYCHAMQRSAPYLWPFGVHVHIHLHLAQRRVPKRVVITHTKAQARGVLVLRRAASASAAPAPGERSRAKWARRTYKIEGVVELWPLRVQRVLADLGLCLFVVVQQRDVRVAGGAVASQQPLTFQAVHAESGHGWRSVLSATQTRFPAPRSSTLQGGPNIEAQLQEVFNTHCQPAGRGVISNPTWHGCGGLCGSGDDRMTNTQSGIQSRAQISM